MEKEIKSINLMSVFRVTFALSLVGIIILSIISLIATLMTDISGLGGWIISLLVGAVFCAVYAAFAALGAWIYNLIASKVGGIKIGLE